MQKWIARAALPTALAVSMALATPAMAVGDEENPEQAGERMVADALIARPIGAVLTLAGSLLFVITLPFTAAADSVEPAAEALVVKPARETFVRCLGCVSTGRPVDGVARE